MLNQLNITTFNAINQFAGTNIILDKFGIITAIYLPIIFILFLIYLWFNKNDYKNLALYSTYSAILGLSTNFLITLFYFHPRPFMDHIGKLLISYAPDTSFPSDHTTLMLSIAFSLLYFKKTRIAGIIFSFLGILGGVARVYSGIHYPFDIVGSIFVAIISSSIIFITKDKLQIINHQIIKLHYKIFHNHQDNSKETEFIN